MEYRLPVSNRMLSALPADEQAEMMGMCQPVALPFRTVLSPAGSMPQHVYFLTSGLASVVSSMATGEVVNVSLVGCEGATGSVHVLGHQPGISNWYMQIPGTGLRMDFRQFLRVFDSLPGLHRRVLQHAQHETLALQRVTACNRTHPAEARLARWLLMAMDRAGSTELPLTQDFIGQMLGTRRSTVTLMLGEMQRYGLVELRRGLVRVKNRDRLMTIACECYLPLFRLFQQLY